MDVIKLLPLLIIWAIWRILSRAKKDNKQTEPSGLTKPERERRPFRTEISSNGQTPQKAPFPAPPFPTTQSKTDRDAVPPVGLKTFVHEKQKDWLRYSKYSRMFLRNAVIWSEILASPVVLRDKSD